MCDFLCVHFQLNSRSGWEDLVTLFGISDSTANGALSLKQIYLRYLDSYEKVHFLGEEEEGEDSWYNDEEESRARRQRAQRVTTTVPLSYNHQQHNVADSNREYLNLPTKVYRKTDYDRLTLSLTSPLPNEQDFAINVCTLLSNEGRHTLKLAKCPRLLDLLLSHAGVYNHGNTLVYLISIGCQSSSSFSENLRDYINKVYLETRKYDLLSFWKEVCKDKTARDLMLRYEPSNSHSNQKTLRQQSSSMEDVQVLETSKDRLEAMKAQVLEELSRSCDADEEGDSLFAQGRGLGTRELAGQRVLQVATIVRNLSFEEDNATILARNLTCLRFCLLCCSSKWSNLNQMGFDILSNVASDITLEEADEYCVTDVLLSTLTSCISSPDRFQVISSLDVLNKLCQLECNEQFIDHVFSDQRSFFEQLVTYLSLHDIHLLISALECLYALSCLGEQSCNAIVRTHSAVDSLVSLITVEAQSYGPKACILMRVVETVPGTSAAAAAAAAQQQQHQAPIQAQQAAAAAVQAAGAQKIPLAQLSSLTPVRPPPQQQQQKQQQPQQQQQVQPQVVQVVQGQQVVRGQIIQVQRAVQPGTVLQLPRHPVPIVRPGQQAAVPRQIVATTTSAAPQQQQIRPQQPQQIIIRQAQPVQQQQGQQPRPVVQQQVQLRVSNDEANRNFCLSWLRVTYESVSGASIQHEIMYKQYLASFHKMGKREVISAQHYAACVR